MWPRRPGVAAGQGARDRRSHVLAMGEDKSSMRSEQAHTRRTAHGAHAADRPCAPTGRHR
ncbi:MAG: hypothetical protein AVDCRST_MAG32-3051 [uncultured Nocardioides sp.]|uniref:Uncharacterized protein n=1 Tax=uncultured Nocardioides sp. TaxID=198441 RepID=A0A6J4P6Y4_9ACTN|nr:MAG: hypothetical protein AVDCRST_MAG32-3051 [uncultured Nocardioides sp.]